MKKQLTQIQEFHKAFNEHTEQTPKLLSPVTSDLRFRLLSEENDEYLDACNENNLIEIADALGDQLYIVLGTIDKHGMVYIIEEVFNRIHISNMSKLDENGRPVINGENGVFDERKPMGKILKSELYKRVDLKDLFIKS